jgi:hypothetical protein
MRRRITTWFAWSLYGIVTCLVVVASGAGLLNRDGSHSVLQLISDVLITIATPVIFAVVAALIVSRQPRNTLGWVLMVPVGLYVVGGPIVSHIERLAPSSPEPTVPILLMAWFNTWNWLLLIFPLLLIPLLFPNGQPPTPRWRSVGVAAIAWASLFVLIAALARQINAGTTPNMVFDNPIGVLGKGTVERLVGVWIVGLLALAVACAVALFVRYRRANEIEREQIKWLLYACALFLMVYAVGLVGRLGGKSSVGGYIWGVFFGLSVIALPAAIGIAILKYRLYDIDVVINRTLVYGPLTATLVALYFVGIVVLQRFFVVLTGQQSTLAVVASTLLIAALFNPLRRRIQAFIDRRFFRSKYDARKTLEDFSVKLRDETNLQALSNEVVGVVKETMQPAHVSVWLRPDATHAAERAE